MNVHDLAVKAAEGFLVMGLVVLVGFLLGLGFWLAHLWVGRA